MDFRSTLLEWKEFGFYPQQKQQESPEAQLFPSSPPAVRGKTLRFILQETSFKSVHAQAETRSQLHVHTAVYYLTSQNSVSGNTSPNSQGGFSLTWNVCLKRRIYLSIT